MMLKEVSTEHFHHRIVLQSARGPFIRFKASDVVLLAARMT